MEYTQYNITISAVHHLSSGNLMGVETSSQCGCFCCCQTFPAVDVTEFAPDGITALCPLCGIDSVLPDSWIKLSGELLDQMQLHWFGGPGGPA